jgi:hypothetical protein
MTNLPLELDLKIQEVQADLISGYEKYNELSSQFADVLYTLDFTSDNSYKVNQFILGLSSLHESFNALLEATKIIAEMRGIVISQN